MASFSLQMVIVLYWSCLSVAAPLTQRCACLSILVVHISSLSGASTAFDAQANYVVLNAAAVNDFFVLVQAPERLRNDAPKEAMLPTVNEEFLRSREERATSRAATDAGKINPQATARAQAVFESLSKTMPTKWLNSDTDIGILVFDDVRHLFMQTLCRIALAACSLDALSTSTQLSIFAHL